MGCGNSKVEATDSGAVYKTQQSSAQDEDVGEEKGVIQGVSLSPKQSPSSIKKTSFDSFNKRDISVKESPTKKSGRASADAKTVTAKAAVKVKSGEGALSSLSYTSKENTKVSSASKHMQARQENYARFPIRLIDFDKFKGQREIPRYPECKDLVEAFDQESFDYLNAIVVYVSHCWIAGWDGKDTKGKVLSQDHHRNWRGCPHPDNKKNDKYKLICEGVESLWMSMAPTFHKCYLWIDYSCISQDVEWPSDEVRYLDLVMRVCDFVITPVVDIMYKKWKPPEMIGGASTDWLFAYKAETFNGTPFSYTSRSWCRMEILLASAVPLADHMGEIRQQKFKGVLQLGCTNGVRSHFVYGTRENKAGLSGRVLKPVEAGSFLETYDPLEGYLSVESDRKKIEQLICHIKPYFSNITGSDSAATVGEEDVVVEDGEVYEDEDGVAEEKTVSHAASSSSRKSMSTSGNGRFKLGNGSLFEGTLKGGRREGFGTLSSKSGDSLFRGEFSNDQKVSGYEKYPDGCVYEGSYVDNQQQGIGHMTMPNGDTYHGEWRAGAMQGVGKYQYASGAVSEGFWIEGKMSGKGKYRSKEGGEYRGHFENDRKHGLGEYRWTNGEVYRGEYRDDKRHGHGTYQFENGDVYDGEWSQDKRTGVGTFTYEGGTAVYKGEFVDGNFHGQGELDFNGRRYEGTFSEGLKHGYGSLKYKNGNIYVGSFVRDKREGSDCRLIYASDHCEYIGGFKDDAMHGLGLYKYSNGDIYRGEFKAGKRHGRGQKTVAATGEIVSGLWSEDKFVKVA